VPLDNASLLARRVYAKNLDLFDQVYASEGKNLRHTIARIIAVARANAKDPYGGLRRWLETTGSRVRGYEGTRVEGVRAERGKTGLSARL
jgi:hypothetical protein